MNQNADDQLNVSTSESREAAALTSSVAEAVPGSPENPLNMLWTIPNLITLCRLLLTGVFLALFPNEDTRLFAIVIFIIASSTDWFDGQVARRFNQVSYFGKRFDPVMDRVLIFSGLIALVMGKLVPLWVVVFLVARDVYLGIGGFVVSYFRKASIDVCYVGKTCTFVLMSGFAVVMLGLFVVPGLGLFELSWLPGFGSEPVSLGMWAIYVGCILSFWAAAIYTVRAIRLFL